MKSAFLFLSLVFPVLCSFASTIKISSHDQILVQKLQNEFLQKGIQKELFVHDANKGSILLVLPDQLEEEVENSKKNLYPFGWFLLLGDHFSEKQLVQSLHEALPQSRVMVVSTVDEALLKIKIILREQERFKQGIAGLNTVPVSARLKCNENEYPLAPLGSAILTHSGILNSTGIKAIIHTGSGSMTQSGEGLEPSKDSVRNSLINALALAREAGHTRVAVPVIAGSIFRERMNNGEGIDLNLLVDLIIDVLVEESAGLQLIMTIRPENPDEGKYIRESLKRLSEADRKHFEVDDAVYWGLVKFESHHASAIINSANMEFLFGGGLSGQVAKAANGMIPGDRALAVGKKIISSAQEEVIMQEGVLPSKAIDEEARTKIFLF